MAMLRVSSYRKLFDEESWRQTGGLSMQCAGQRRASRGAAVDKCKCHVFDFVAAKSLSEEGLNRFVQDRTVIAALNDRLVRLIELARCFEVENETLECQIVELEEKLSSEVASFSVATTVAEPDYTLDAVVEKLRKERDEILCDTKELQNELERLRKCYEKDAQQRSFFQQERQHVAEEVDAVTAECLALREQAAIYEEQLANMEAQHKTAAEHLLEPVDGTTLSVAAIKFGSPDITVALDVKEYYCRLAESLQHECEVAAPAVVYNGHGRWPQVRGAAGSQVKDLPKMKDMGDMKMLVSELQTELAELEKRNEDLEDEVEMKKAAHMDEIAELECIIDETRHRGASLRAQMKEQCEDYRVLLGEKMARDVEIVAYRSLMEEEEERLRSL